MGKAGLNDGALVPQAFFGPAPRQRQRGQIWAAESGQFDAFKVVPDAFGRVEVRGIARELLEVEALGGASCEEVLDRLATMNGRDEGGRHPR